MSSLLDSLRNRTGSLPKGLAVGLLAGVVFGLWWVYTPEGLLGKADAIGYAVCHRIDLRSFHLGDRPLPLCARCTGMYLGAVLSLGVTAARGRERKGGLPTQPMLATLGLIGLGFAVDGTNSYLHLFPGAPGLYEPSNLLRLITGTLMGLVLANLLLIGFNQNAWRIPDAQPALSSITDLMAFLLPAAALDAAVLSENPLILYPLALISSAGVVLILSTIHATIMLLVFRHENRAERWRDLALPLTAGFALAMTQIAVLDLGRYLLTGTWAGFTL